MVCLVLNAFVLNDLKTQKQNNTVNQAYSFAIASLISIAIVLLSSLAIILIFSELSLTRKTKTKVLEGRLDKNYDPEKIKVKATKTQGVLKLKRANKTKVN